MDIYGIVVWSRFGHIILDESSMVQSWGNTMIDNIDENNPMLLRFKFPSNSKEMIDFKLSIDYAMYRTYSGADQSGSLSTTSTNSAHIHSVGTTTGTCSLSMTYDTLSVPFSSSAGHTHSNGTDYRSTGVCEAEHTHNRSITLSSSGAGTHNHVISNHKHNLVWGIHTAGHSSLTVNIHINGSLFLSNVDPDQAYDIDIPQNWFNFPGWNDITISSSAGISRVNANYFTQVYIGT